MPWSLFELYALLPAFLLVLFRISGLMLAAPVFSSGAIPLQFKALLAVAMSAAVFPLMAVHVTAPVTLSSVVGGMLGELAIGLLIGFGVSLLFAGIQMAGHLISQQAGLALGEVFNPMLDTSSTVVSDLYFMVALVVFLGVGGDHALIRALLDSFASVPPMTFEITPAVTVMLVDLMTASFTLAIRLSGPVVLALLLAFLTLGFVSRTVPQLNILTVGFPIKMALAIALMAVSMISLETVLIDGLHVCMDGVRESLGLDAV